MKFHDLFFPDDFSMEISVKGSCLAYSGYFHDLPDSIYLVLSDLPVLNASFSKKTVYLSLDGNPKCTKKGLCLEESK